MTPPDLEPRLLRAVLGRFATGVAVVSTRTESGTAVGMTVNSFSSVSLDPPMVLFCVSRSSQLRRPFVEGSHYAVSVLDDTQSRLSRQFARPGLDRSGEMGFATGRGGLPVVPGALAVVECETASVVPAGDHDIVLGRVVAAEADPTRPPLVFFGGGYRRLDPEYADWWTAFT